MHPHHQYGNRGRSYEPDLIFLGPISRLFSGGDPQFQQMICSIYQMEALGSIPLGINAAVMALLYGFGKTRISLIINFSRVFIFRVPVLWGLQQFTDLEISAPESSWP